MDKTNFISNQNNKLMVTYDLDEVSSEILYDILKVLYKKRAACTYEHAPTELKKLVNGLVLSKFRTYDFDSMTGLHMIDIAGID